MKKIILVDDEILIRESIRERIDWENERFHYCGDAADGELALPLIEQHLPDIVITDIKMPFMDGLELCAVVRQRFPHIKVIILSGHDDFHYVQTALRLGATDYCLKPFSAADLLQLLRTVSDRIDQEENAKKCEHYTAEKLFADLCGGLVNTVTALKVADQLKLPLMTSHYAVAILTLCSTDLTKPELDPASCWEAGRWVDGRLSEQIDCFMYKRSRTDTVLILKGKQAEDVCAPLHLLVNELQLVLNAQFNCELTVSLGSVQERLQGIHRSYVEAEAQQMAGKLSRQHKAAYMQTTFDSSYETVLLDRNGLLDFLKLGSPQAAPDFMLTFTAGLDNMNWDSPYAYYLLHHLTLEMVAAAKQNFQTSRSTEDVMAELQQQLKRIASRDECQHYLLQLLTQLWEWRQAGADKYGELIDKAKLYIRQHYGDDQLSLYEVSKQLAVSSSHLSKIFSQETGQTMTDYLTLLRIGKAKELLKMTRHKTFEIAFQVGYKDPHYFSNLFKKITGLTPTEYRKHNVAHHEQVTAEGKRQ
ncbi:response regulator [Paenibacillus campi]|uniref:response regulator n=1 Tax=Paenibacillus campi TaxID=3106031 RepID=UPI002AFFF9AD|nr:response regulator [Paenibacillus sp. SGZ-1014]